MRRRIDKSSNSISTFQAAGAPFIRGPSAGELQMAVTAIDHGGRVITVTSQLAKFVPAMASQNPTFTTCIHGGPLNASVWQANTWGKTLENHAGAVSKLVKLITADESPSN